MNTNYSPCDFVHEVRDNHPKPLTWAHFESLLDDMNVRFLTEKVREHKPDAELYKKQLPGICWQSRFAGQLRTDKNAQPTGLFCLDVDIHHEDMFRVLLHDKGSEEAYAWAENEARQRAQMWAERAKNETIAPDDIYEEKVMDICAVHVSPSGTGIHVVAWCHHSCKSIAENQARLARMLGTSYDEVCKDWARLFLIVPREDWTYINKSMIFEYETEDDS